MDIKVLLSLLWGKIDAPVFGIRALALPLSWNTKKRKFNKLEISRKKTRKKDKRGDRESKESKEPRSEPSPRSCFSLFFLSPRVLEMRIRVRIGGALGRHGAFSRGRRRRRWVNCFWFWFCLFRFCSLCLVVIRRESFDLVVIFYLMWDAESYYLFICLLGWESWHLGLKNSILFCSDFENGVFNV